MEGGEDVPTLADLTSHLLEENEDSDEWDEMEVAGEQTTCLFCSSQFLTIAVALDHCRTKHNFNLLDLKSQFQMDCYSYIKMINYIRKNKPQASEIVDSPLPLWDDDVYLKPGDMEPWLMYDFDDLGSTPSTPHYAIDGKTPLSNINYSDLQRQINELQEELRHKDSLLETARANILQMQEVTRTIIEGPTNESTNQDTDNFSTCSLRGDSEYFNSYSHFGIHYEMLTDKIRTDSYRDAILNNSELFSGKTVLDVGCGTGILSMFAARAGASKVYGVDQSEVVYKAMDIVRENDLHEVIHLMKDQVEHISLPVEKVDIIISEWMGYFLLFEGMLDSFVYARNKYLQPGGVVMPNKCSMSIVGISDLDYYNKFINFWDNVYGFTMKCFKKEVLSEAFIDTVPEDKLITDPNTLVHIDLNTCDIHVCEFSSKFKLNVLKDGFLTALAGYFDILFDFKNTVEFSTGPQATKTHWQQTIFYLRNVIEVKKGDIIEGSLTCSRLKNNLRSLSVTISLGNDRYQYILD